MIIPFSVGGTAAALGADIAGMTSNVLIAGFGSHSQDVSLPQNGQFTLTDTQGTFVIPCDATVKRISVAFSNAAAISIPAEASIYPYIVLAAAPLESNIFTIIAATETLANTPWTGGSIIPAGSSVFGYRRDIAAAIPENSRMAICCAIKTTGMSESQKCYIYCSGGISLA
jgi:hypothetical protein